MNEPARGGHALQQRRAEGGWRRRFRESDVPAPLVSIITSTLNAARHLPHTIGSVAAQHGKLSEWIVVDGGSSDDTVDLLRGQDDLIALWLSEPDAGIYDAWNKACALARGQWLIFLGAGDEFAASDTLQRFSQCLAGANPAHDLVYGKLIYISSVDRQDLDEVGAAWSEMQGRWELCRPALPPHPAIFHHRSLFARDAAFDARFRLAGDTHFLLRHALRKPPLFVPITVCRTPIDGVSMNLRSALALSREIRQMNMELAIVPPVGHRLAENVLLAAKIVVGWVPAKIGRRIADLYRHMTGRARRWSVR